MALEHTETAIELDPRLGEALFQAGKVLMAIGEPSRALSFLRRAIEVDKGYALKAAGDRDYQAHERDVRDLLEQLRKEKIERVRPELHDAMRRYQFFLVKSHPTETNRLVRRIGELLGGGMPLWDVLAVLEDVQQFHQAHNLVSLKA